MKVEFYLSTKMKDYEYIPKEVLNKSRKQVRSVFCELFGGWTQHYVRGGWISEETKKEMTEVNELYVGYRFVDEEKVALIVMKMEELAIQIKEWCNQESVLFLVDEHPYFV